jgi:hypothetical protein
MRVLRAGFVAGLTALSVLAAGCAHIPVSTMYTLWTFDMLAADPAAIRAAVRYPASLAPRPGGAKLTVTGPANTDRAVHTYILEEVTGAGELAQISAFKRTGYPVRGYRLSDADVAAVHAVIKDIVQAKRRSEIRSGSLGVSVDACHVSGLSPNALLTSTYLKLESGAPYMPVIEDVDLKKEFGSEELAEHIPPCAAG